MTLIWEERDQIRWNELSRKCDPGPLTADEQREYDQLAERLEAEEPEYLQPAIQRVDGEIDALRRVRREGEQLIAHLETLLAQRQAEDERWQQRARALERECAGVRALYRRRVDDEASVAARAMA